MKKNDQVTDYIEKAPPAQKAILEGLRKLIHEAVPEVSEALKWGQPVFTKTKDFCYLKAAKNHVNLGFMNFSGLEDPEGLLEGAGKTMRHVKLKSESDIKPALFKKWFKTAAI